MEICTDFNPDKQKDPKYQEARVGVCCLIVHNDKFLFGLRAGMLGANTWGMPGGHLEFGESVEDCCVRETKEETNLDITVENLYDLGWNQKLINNRHYITIFVLCKTNDLSKLSTMEPEKCQEWKWFSHEELKNINLFETTGSLRAIERYINTLN